MSSSPEKRERILFKNRFKSGTSLVLVIFTVNTKYAEQTTGNKELSYLPIFTVQNYHGTEVGRSCSAVFKTKNV